MPTTVELLDELQARLEPMRFAAPVAHVYHPYVYAREPFLEYFARYGGAPREVLLVGMNPGPWGMAQTGVPFGAVPWVRDWLGITGHVGKPEREHEKRPVEGFECGRVEVSGDRLWGWIAERFGTPEAFFSRFFVYNYCPLLFLNERGANVTPDKIKVAQRRPLLKACDATLRGIAERLGVETVIGVGAFAEKSARRALADVSSVRRVERVLHPSPASPAANRGWARQAEATFERLGVSLDR